LTRPPAPHLPEGHELDDLIEFIRPGSAEANHRHRC
jgi:hypothetical protein